MAMDAWMLPRPILFDDTVSILLGHGDGTFQGMPVVAMGDIPLALALGNFNGDGSLDIVDGEPAGRYCVRAAGTRRWDISIGARRSGD